MVTPRGSRRRPLADPVAARRGRRPASGRIVGAVTRRRVRDSEALLEQRRPRIYRRIRKLVRTREDAEDLTQETLLRAQQRLGTLEEPAALDAWLRRIAANVTCDFLRRAAHGSPLGETAEPDPGQGDRSLAEPHDAGLEHLVQNAEMAACGRPLLASLSGPDRQVIWLHDVEGLTGVEIARLLGCTPGAVKIRLHRARRRFREVLESACDFYRDERGVLVGGPKPGARRADPPAAPRRRAAPAKGRSRRRGGGRSIDDP